MAGSSAEERIREKAVAMLRALFPEGRIIHELVVAQGVSIIDVACITSTGLLVGVEIKSERDVTHRLERQVRHARKVCDLYAVCAHSAMADKIKILSSPHLPDMVEYAPGCWHHMPNPEYISGLHYLTILKEADTGFDVRYSWADPDAFRLRLAPVKLNPFDRMNMLWAEELRALTGAPTRTARAASMDIAARTLTVEQIRNGVMHALRNRRFARADELRLEVA